MSVRASRAVSFYPKHIAGYWGKVAWMVGTRSAEECHKQHTSQETSQTSAIKNKKQKNEKVDVPKLPGKCRSLFGMIMLRKSQN